MQFDVGGRVNSQIRTQNPKQVQRLKVHEEKYFGILDLGLALNFGFNL
jgi:hypothetical protein